MALGKIGDRSAQSVAGGAAADPRRPRCSRRSRPPLCLIGIDCDAADDVSRSRRSTFAATTDGDRPLLSGVAHALGVLARRGHDRRARRAVRRRRAGARRSAREPIALAVGPWRCASRSGARRRSRRGSDRRRRRRSRCATRSTCCRRGFRAKSGSTSRCGAAYWDAAAESASRRGAPGAHRQAGVLMSGADLSDSPASTSTPATRSCAASRRSRAAPTRRACCRASDRSADCSRSMASIPDPVLVASADGVGTKLKVAFMAGRARHDRRRSRQSLRQRHPRAGRAAAVLSRLPRDRAAGAGRRRADRVAGLAAACRENGCALLGGETAEMPGFYATASTTSRGSSSGSSRAAASSTAGRFRPATC